MSRILPISLLAALGVLLATASAQASDVAVGEPAPDFELTDQDGRLHSLEDYRDRWVVLFFYPKDGTPGCTTEVCEFRDNIFAYRDLNAQILGISLDDVDSHKAFSEKHGLPYPLLADSDGIVASTYGVKTRMFGLNVAKRQTFIINPEGKIAKHYEKVRPATHSAQVLDDLTALVRPAETEEPDAPDASVASEAP